MFLKHLAVSFCIRRKVSANCVKCGGGFPKGLHGPDRPRYRPEFHEDFEGFFLPLTDVYQLVHLHA